MKFSRISSRSGSRTETSQPLQRCKAAAFQPSTSLTRLIGGIAIATLLSALPVEAAVLPGGFAESQYGANVGTSPTAMEFAPDGRLFVCLQGGALHVISTNGTLLLTPFVTVPTSATGERGLLGVAFDPNFASNQFIYVYYTVTTSPIHNRVSRFTANGNVAAAGSETVILDLDNLGGPTNHNGGAIHFGPDGKLYIAVGDNANAANAQVLSNRLGKILRINADGTIPSDNPTSFPGITGSPSGANRSIWAVGVRNPFTCGFQPGTGRLFINDVGQNAWEEINDGIAGSNYGWNGCEGFCSPSNANYRDPLLAYGHGGTPTTGCAIVGGAFYNPAINQFPASYSGKYFFGDYCSGWIRLFDLSNSSASAFATGVSSLVDLKVGPDGSLYYLARGNGGQVWRVRSTTATPTPAPMAISGAVSFCSNPSPDPVLNATLTLTGSSSGSTASDVSGNYQFSALAGGGGYTVTPSKPDWPPGSTGITTVDLVAIQRHYLNIAFLIPGCQLTAGDVNGDTLINTNDAIAVQRFAIGQTSGIANVGKYQFSPASRTYPALAINQVGQNYDALVLGDVSAPFADRAGGPSQDAAAESASAREVAAMVALPDVGAVRSRSDFVAAVTTTALDGKNQLVGFQGDFTFDERVITFESVPVQKAGITGGNWNVSGNVLAGSGPIRTLRVSAYSTDFTPLSGEGTLFELMMRTIPNSALRIPHSAVPLIWAAAPGNFIFIDADLDTYRPREQGVEVISDR